MPENKSANLKSFVFVKVRGGHHGYTFHPQPLMPCDPFMSIFGCDFHPVNSITSRLFDSQVPFTDPFHRSLFRSHASFASLCFSAPLFSFRTVPEQFKGMF